MFHPKTSENLPQNWTFDSKSQVLLGRFESSTLSDSEMSTLASMLCFDDIAVVTEGLVGWSGPTDAIDFVKKCYPKEAQLSAISFTSALREDNIVTTEREHRRTLTPEQYAAYLEKQRSLIKTSESLIAAVSADDDSCYVCSKEGRLHVGKEALYLVDFDLKKSYLHQSFMEQLGTPMKKMLPSSNWCLTKLVSIGMVLFSYYHSLSHYLFSSAF